MTFQKSYTLPLGILFVIAFFIAALIACGSREPSTKEIMDSGKQIKTNEKNVPVKGDDPYISSYCKTCTWAFRVQPDILIAGDELNRWYKSFITYQALTTGLTDPQQLELLESKDYYLNFGINVVNYQILRMELEKRKKAPQTLINKLIPLIPGYLTRELINRVYLYQVVAPSIDTGQEAISDCFAEHEEDFKDIPFSEAVEYCKQEILQSEMPKKMEHLLNQLKSEQKIKYDIDQFRITFIHGENGSENPATKNLKPDDTFGFEVDASDYKTLQDEMDESSKSYQSLKADATTPKTTSVDLPSSGITEAELSSKNAEVVLTQEQFDEEYRSYVYLMLVSSGVTDEAMINEALADDTQKRQFMRMILHTILMERSLIQQNLYNKDTMNALVQSYLPIIQQQIIMFLYLGEEILPTIKVTEKEVSDAVKSVRSLYEAQGYPYSSIVQTVQMEIQSQKAQQKLMEKIQALQNQYTIEKNTFFFQ